MKNYKELHPVIQGIINTGTFTSDGPTLLQYRDGRGFVDYPKLNAAHRVWMDEMKRVTNAFFEYNKTVPRRDEISWNANFVDAGQLLATTRWAVKKVRKQAS
jgi:hypothetical protein